MASVLKPGDVLVLREDGSMVALLDTFNWHPDSGTILVLDDPTGYWQPGELVTWHGFHEEFDEDWDTLVRLDGSAR